MGTKCFIAIGVFSVACVAGGISRASALFWLRRRERKWRSRGRIGEESS